MSLELAEIMQAIEEVAPISLQENYDNSGLIVGNSKMQISSALLSLDCTPEVVLEAIDKGCNLVISHHPIVFSGLKRFNGNTYVDRAIQLAIKHDVALYACHTNLDSVLHQGVNHKIASRLALIPQRVLSPQKNTLLKLSVTVPTEYKMAVENAIFKAGAGQIGNYKDCGFSWSGVGSYTPQTGANPFEGSVDEPSRVEEQKFEVVFPFYLKRQVLDAMFYAHPYEEVAYELVALENEVLSVGSGLICQFREPMSQPEFLAHLKKSMDLETFKYTRSDKITIHRVAICGGSGAFLISKAKQEKCDAYITSDVKYHEYFDAENDMLLCDIGHFESEKYTVSIFAEILSKKFPNFATIFAHTNTNPVQYYK